jgi:hypothetical protein
MAIDAQQNVWISHPYHGVFRIQKRNDKADLIVKYDTKKGLPSLLNNHVFKIKEKILAATEQGIFQYEPATDRFMIAAEFRTLLGN